MSLPKQQYLDSVRSNTSYPVFRGIIGTITLIWYIVAAIEAVGALFSGFAQMRYSFLTGVGYIIVGAIAAVLTYAVARFLKEAALILADIADSTVETNARNHSGQ